MQQVLATADKTTIVGSLKDVLYKKRMERELLRAKGEANGLASRLPVACLLPAFIVAAWGGYGRRREASLRARQPQPCRPLFQ